MGQKIKSILLGSIPFLFILSMWQVGSTYTFFPEWLVPSPIDVARSFYHLTKDGTIFGLVILSMLNIIPSFIAAVIVGLILGILIGLSGTVRKVFHPFLSALYPIPSLAWLPFVVLLFGFTREAIWALIFISAFTKIIYNIIDGVRAVKPHWILVAKNFEVGKFETILTIIIPAALPQIITGVRIGFGSAWRSLVGAEMLVTSLGGLGKFIWTAQWFFDFEKVISGLLVIAFIGIVIEHLVFRRLEKMTTIRWGLISDDHEIA